MRIITKRNDTGRKNLSASPSIAGCIALISCLLLLYAACTDSSSDKPSKPSFVPVTGITVNGGSSIEMTERGTITLNANVAPEKATNKTVTWAVTGTTAADNSASFGTGANSNKLTASTHGTVNVTATIINGLKSSGAGKDYTQSFSVTVKYCCDGSCAACACSAGCPYECCGGKKPCCTGKCDNCECINCENELCCPQFVPVTRIEFNMTTHTIYLKEYQELLLQASVYPHDATVQDIKFSIESGGDQTVSRNARIDSENILHVSSSGKVTVTATVLGGGENDTNISDTIEIEVTDEDAPTTGTITMTITADAVFIHENNFDLNGAVININNTHAIDISITNYDEVSWFLNGEKLDTSSHHLSLPVSHLFLGANILVIIVEDSNGMEYSNEYLFTVISE